MGVRFRASGDVDAAAPHTCQRPSLVSLGKASAPGDSFIVRTLEAGAQPRHCCRPLPQSGGRDLQAPEETSRDWAILSLF